MNRRSFIASVTASATVGASARAFDRSKASALEALVMKSGFCGTALVTLSSSTLLFKGFGSAERSFRTPCAPDTRYRIASITKLFTATVIVQLASERKLDLDKTLGVYLPNYVGPARDRSTLRQLLHHTSGIENFDKLLTSFASAMRVGMPAYQMPHSSDDLLNDFASGPLVHEPGSVFDYNNADFVILGKIIEAVEANPMARSCSNGFACLSVWPQQVSSPPARFSRSLHPPITATRGNHLETIYRSMTKIGLQRGP